MISRALDSNNDLMISKGNFRLVEDGAEVVQHVRTRLQFYKGEWFLDLKAGVPYFQEILVKPAQIANTESLIKSSILNTVGVDKLTSFTSSYEGGSIRKLTLSFSAETTYGLINNEEVTINA